MDVDKLYNEIPLSINQVQKVTGVKKPTLRYWEKVFSDYLAPGRTSGNQRSYSPTDIKRVINIRQLLFEEKYTIEGARRRLGINENNSVPQTGEGR